MRKILSAILWIALALLAITFIVLTIVVRIEYANTPIADIPGWAWYFMPR